MEQYIQLAHGAGGSQTNELIETVFKKHLASPAMTADDAAVLTIGAEKLAFTTDGFIVSNNVEALECHVIDEAFAASDHNPVRLTFQLITETEAKHYELGPYKAVSGL